MLISNSLILSEARFKCGQKSQIVDCRTSSKRRIVRRKLLNYAVKLRRTLTKSGVIVRHFQLTFGSNWLQLCVNDVVGRPDQTPEHQKQQKQRPA